jgi:uncharacterized phage infection (PIP) family protein YhgE
MPLLDLNKINTELDEEDADTPTAFDQLRAKNYQPPSFSPQSNKSNRHVKAQVNHYSGIKSPSERIDEANVSLHKLQ